MTTAWDDKTPELITRARLLHLPPFAVYEELKRYGDYVEDSRYGSEKLEEALLAKEDPLINLGLAQFGVAKKVVAELYQRSVSTSSDPNYNRALRLAVLGNKGIPKQFMSGKFGILEDAELTRIAASGENDEVWAILSNPSAKELISCLYNRKPPFDAVPEDRFISFVHISHRNPCINEDDSSIHGPDMTAWHLHKGIWNLLKTLPLTEQAMDALYWLLNTLDPRHHAGLAEEDPVPVFKRWQSVQLSEKFKKCHNGMKYTNLDYKEEFGVLLAAQYHAYSANKMVAYVGALDAPDLFLRCSHYGHAGLTVEQMQKVHDRDGDAFTLAAMFNGALFWDPKTRGKLEHFMRGRLIGLYRRRCQQIHKGKPAFDLIPVSEDGVMVLEDERAPSSEEKRWARLEEQLTAAAKQLKTLARLGQWILVLLVIALVLLWKR